MSAYRVAAIPSEVARLVRATRVSPRYGHPAHEEVATGHGPCRHCLRTFQIGEERRILFTYDPFDTLEALPLPGPVFVHAEECGRYPEDAGFPEQLRAHALTLNAYGRGRQLREQAYAANGDLDACIERLFARADVDYIHVRDTSAGCYDLRLDRENGSA